MPAIKQREGFTVAGVVCLWLSSMAMAFSLSACNEQRPIKATIMSDSDSIGLSAKQQAMTTSVILDLQRRLSTLELRVAELEAERQLGTSGKEPAGRKD